MRSCEPSPKRLPRKCVGDDAVGRRGGEEFVVLLVDVDIAELATIAERVRRSISSFVVTITAGHGSGTVHDLTISIGGVRYLSPGLDALDDLLLAADSALYTAKQAGRDRVHLPTPSPVDSPPPAAPLNSCKVP